MNPDYSRQNFGDWVGPAQNGSQYSEPFWWWGPSWESPAPRGIDELLRDETIDAWTAANLWAALARHSSLAVVAGPSGMGKTTLLTALLNFLPPQSRRIYLRGCYETFAFLSDSAVVASETALLINEISPHLPVYSWGPSVRRMLEATDRGYSLMATAHADTVVEFVGALTGSPLRIPVALVAAFEFVVVMELTTETRSGRRVRGVWRLRRTTSGVDLEELSAQPSRFEEASQSEYPTWPWFPVREIAARQQSLIDLRERRIPQLPLISSP